MSKFVKSEYIQTETGNIISRKAIIHGVQNIVLKGKCIVREDTILRGDLRRSGVGSAISISFGSYCYIGKNSIMKPPFKIYKNQFSYYPIKMGDFVTIGDDCLVEAATIGNCVEIGNGVVIGAFTVVKDCVKILDGVIVPPYSVIPPFSLVSMEGIEEWTESATELRESEARFIYHKKFQI
jgi:dynactin-5